ncbi:hypothetical protein THS27_07830 [Thalassospira sp. MCCC 1A01428]|nr:hypothetical protein THS27_07830 [Thalassospira sp. MCCC 1A01428]
MYRAFITGADFYVPVIFICLPLVVGQNQTAAIYRMFQVSSPFASAVPILQTYPDNSGSMEQNRPFLSSTLPLFGFRF